MMILRMTVTGLIAIGCLCLGSTAFAQQGYGQDMGGGGMGGGGMGGGGEGGGAVGESHHGGDTPQLGNQAIPQDPYSKAMLLKQKGQYSDAMPLLLAIAQQGHGYEIAQLELGKCYFDLAGQNKVATDAAQLRTKGFAWVLKSAEDGLGTAEEELVRIYLDGNGVPVDKVEAAKWYFLWRRNPSRMQIGNAQFNVALEERLKADLNQADWQDAQRRADNWRPL